MQSAVMTKKVSEAEARQIMNEKAARAEKAAKIWDQHPLFKGKLSKLTEAHVRQNAAINLTNQARYMKQLNEQETSAEFQKMAPANMMRLVQLTMTNLNRGNVFNEYAMESARDAIYYIKPFFSKSVAANATNMATRSMGYNAATGTPTDPFGFDEGTDTQVGGYNGQFPAYGGKSNVRNGATNTNARKSVYESKESRFANELANATAIALSDKVVTITWKNNEFGTSGEGYIPGSTKIYYGTDERNVIAIQDPSTFDYMIAPEFAGTTIVDSPRSAASSAVTTTITFATDTQVALVTTAAAEEGGTATCNVNAYARFESETDYEGVNLGEVTLNTAVYELRPRRTSIGVSWTKLSEITLDASYNAQVDDILLTSAADVIHSQMDLQAFKDAYSIARTNPSIYHVTFDAGYAAGETVTTTDDTKTVSIGGSKDSYEAIANTFPAAIEIAGAALYSDIHRGQINKLVVGVSVAPYLKLMAGFSPKGLQDATGVYKIGELDGIDVYKAPMEVLPDNEVLCVYKNQKVDNDVAIVFGTLVPFVSNKLEYPTFYTRAGLASFGDKAVLNPKYLARITVENLKDRINYTDYASIAGF